MTMSNERTKALLRAGSFLIELARDDCLPLAVRGGAVVIARHFPTVEDIAAMSLLRYPFGQSAALASPDEFAAENKGGRFGFLRYSTRVVWPEES